MPWRSNPQLLESYLTALRSAMIGWALLVGVAGILYFLDPTETGTSSVRKALTGPGPLSALDELWSMTYAVGGMATAFGVWKERATFARPGLTLLLGALCLNLASIIYIRGIVDGLIQTPPYAVAVTIFWFYLRYLETERKSVVAAAALLDLEAKYERRGSVAPDTGDRDRDGD